MDRAKRRWILPAFVLFVTLLGSVILYKVNARSAPFLTTSSPGNTYTLALTGQKERPLFFTVEVRFDVLKNGNTFLSDRYLHSGDAMDLSFELGYPQHRWINESSLQFYRDEYFNDGKPDTLVVRNNTSKPIKFIRLDSVDKFLIFDLQPGSSFRTLNSRPRGDSKWLAVVGEFSDGRNVVGNEVSLRVNKNLSGPFTYNVLINDDKTIFELQE